MSNITHPPAEPNHENVKEHLKPLAWFQTLPLGTRLASGALAAVIILGGISALTIATTQQSPDQTSVAATETNPTKPAPSITTASPSPSAQPSTSPSSAETAKAGETHTSTQEQQAPAAADQTQELPAAPQPGAPALAAPAVQAPAAAAPGPAYVAPAPAPAAPVYVAPAPAPVAPAPAAPVAPPAPKPAGRTEGLNQSYSTINSHRVSSGVPGFVPLTAACSPVATVTGTALDAYQHQDVVLGVFGRTTGAAFSKGAVYDTLTVYRCS